MFAGDQPTSDAIRLLNCLGGYLYAEKTETGAQFCKQNFIREKIIKEMCKLRLQLVTIIKRSLGEYACVKSLSISRHHVLPPPDAKMLVLVRQIMYTGFPDRIARLDENVSTRIPAFGSGKTAVPAYQSMWSKPDEVLVIHSDSCLSRVRPPPKWLVFEESVGRSQIMNADVSGVLGRAEMTLLGEVIPAAAPTTPQTYQKLSLKGVTAVNQKWMVKLGQPLFLHMGKVLPQPEPRYVGESDGVVGFATPHYGPKLWDLDVCQIDLTSGDAASGAFAASLLMGKVLKGPANVFSVLKDHLVSNPQILVRSTVGGTASLLPRVRFMVNSLSGAGVCSRKALVERWVKEPRFLLEAYLYWVPPVLHEVVRVHVGKEGWMKVGALEGKVKEWANENNDF